MKSIFKPDYNAFMSIITVASIFSIILGIYILIGLVFGLIFIFRVVDKIDESAVDVSIWFRLIILPGTIAFWPSLLKKWLTHKKVEAS